MSEYRLKDLVKIKNGRDHKSLTDGVYPVYGSGGLMRMVDSYLYDKPSILLPRKGTLNNIQYSDQPFWTVDTLYYTEINQNKVDAYYLYYYLKLLDLNFILKSTLEFRFRLPKSLIFKSIVPTSFLTLSLRYT